MVGGKGKKRHRMPQNEAWMFDTNTDDESNKEAESSTPDGKKVDPTAMRVETTRFRDTSLPDSPRHVHEGHVTQKVEVEAKEGSDSKEEEEEEEAMKKPAGDDRSEEAEGEHPEEVTPSDEFSSEPSKDAKSSDDPKSSFSVVYDVRETPFPPHQSTYDDNDDNPALARLERGIREIVRELTLEWMAEEAETSRRQSNAEPRSGSESHQRQSSAKKKKNLLSRCRSATRTVKRKLLKR